jgi:predicted RNA-binding protein with PIN domain
LETFIIDAYNLMHKIPELKRLLGEDRDSSVDTMIAKLQDHFYHSRNKVILVFDGHGKNKISRSIEVRFASTDINRSYENADKLIKVIIDQSGNKKLLTVVSSDNEIKWYARDSGCTVKSSRSFWSELKKKRTKKAKAMRESEEKPQVVTKGEVEYLLKVFTKK